MILCEAEQDSWRVYLEVLRSRIHGQAAAGSDGCPQACSWSVVVNPSFQKGLL